MMIVTLSVIHFFTELTKNIQSYGIISLQYDYNNFLEKQITFQTKSQYKKRTFNASIRTYFNTSKI